MNKLRHVRECMDVRECIYVKKEIDELENTNVCKKATMKERLNMNNNGYISKNVNVRKKPHVIKIVIGGDGAVGKTTLVKRLLGILNNTDTRMTPGLEICNLKVSGNTSTTVATLWDLGGQEQFRFFQADFFKGAKIVILVYSVEWIHSFLNLDCWISLIPKNKAPLKVYLVANKIDTDKRAVNREEGLQLAKEHNMQFYEVSAVTGEGFEPFKKDLIETIKYDFVETPIAQDVHEKFQTKRDLKTVGSDNDQMEENDEYNEGKNHCLSTF